MGLKHPFHDEHPLILRILSDNCKIECKLCHLQIHGPTYCCDDCDYFLHGSCAVIELPPKVRHPSHRRHPLALSGENDYYAYRCSKCSDFSLHALTAFATLPLLDDKKEQKTVKHNKEEGIVRHYAHKEHPLASFHVEMTLFDTCKGCEQRISGQVYGCRACLFLLHASCARSPLSIDHPFCSGLTQYDASANVHLSGDCNVCGVFIFNGFAYSRPGGDGSDGSFRLHMGCALSTMFPPGHPNTHSTDLKKYGWHSCPLVLFYIEEATYVPICCKICELYILGEARGCPKCRVFLHKSCAENLPEVIQHYLHQDHPNLVLGPRRGDKKTRRASRSYSDYTCCCAACRASSTDSDRTFDMAFKCDECAFFLIPKCALQTLSVVEDGAAASISHFAHDHTLLLHFIRTKNHVQYCIACVQHIDVGLAYCCVTCDSIRLHKSCAELPQELQHPFHPQHLLVLLSNASYGYFHCSACHKKSTGFAYHCVECDFYLDVECASLNPTLKHPRHEHKLAYFKESVSEALSCAACGQRCNMDLYRCVPCDFRLHYDCLPLPPKIKHEGHRLHPVFLQDKFVDGDPNYQYCDHCEELRHPEQGVYRCEECWFAAHIHCMISKGKFHVEVEATETEALEAEATEPEALEAEGTETTYNPVPDQVDPKVLRIKTGIDVLRRNIEAMRENVEATRKELDELRIERESLCSY